MKITPAFLLLVIAPVISAKGPRWKTSTDAPPATTDGPPATTVGTTSTTTVGTIATTSGPPDTTSGPPDTTGTSGPCGSTMQTVKIYAAWDWALCDYVKSENVQVSGSGCDDTSTDMERATCYVEDIIAKANVAYNAFPLCVNLEAEFIPDTSCTQSGSMYEFMNVEGTQCGGFASEFIDKLPSPTPTNRPFARHMFAGSEVGTNIGCADYNTLCRPRKGGATWVRDGKWGYFAHELGHQLGRSDHIKGKEAKQGDYIMESFIPSRNGEFAPSSMDIMKAFIETRLNMDGSCKD